MADYAKLIRQCDDDIKSGRPREAAKRLSALNASRVERQWRLPLAKLCRRSGLVALGLKLLTRLILTEKYGAAQEPSAAELAEYAVLLQRSGALSEAMQKLERVDTSQAPEAHLYRAFIHFARWEFADAVPELQNYLKSDLDPYARSVGETNLAFALVECRRGSEALPLLDSLVQAQSQQLRSNAYALRGQLFLQEQNFSKARVELQSALDLVHGAQTNDQLFALKWMMILEGMQNRDLLKFHELREVAARHRAWEALREADLYSLKAGYDRERFVHLYFGSPFAGFRERIRAEFGEVPQQPIYVFGKKSVPRMDLRTGHIDGHAVFPPGHLIHQLLDALLHDFYRPIRVAGLFSALFPGEQFDVSSSPHRVHQLILRTRQSLSAQGIPVGIIEQNGFYRLSIDGPFSFRVPLERRPVSPAQLQFNQLQEAFGTKTAFSAKQARARLNLSAATIHRLLHRGLREGHIARAGGSKREPLFMMMPAQRALRQAA